MKVLIVEDDDLLRRSIGRFLAGEGHAVTGVRSVLEGIAELRECPDLIITDVALPDGSGLLIVTAAQRTQPVPLIIAISGEASAREGFLLRDLGASGYLAKPISLDDLRDEIARVQERVPSIESDVANSVGKLNLSEMKGRVRRAMLEQALALTNWVYTDAGELLGVSRQAVQQMVKEYGLQRPPHTTEDPHAKSTD